ncbi:hypothetical protein C0583_02340 [Candidatus Parcubacteria bacterium]|nr:MAG: hypothetical protein C0583_02340 [Candidatus Parcubacteria bacterium]
MEDIIKKIEKANLVGRGGGCFPTAKKWEMVAKAIGPKKYVVCNFSEGEPGVKKDEYILKNYALEMIEGMKIAMDTIGAEDAFVYLNPDYYKKYYKNLKELSKGKNFEIFKKSHTAGYIGGEETSALNHIEGHKVEPRLRPPFPTTNGLWNMPTLVNNPETFYHVCLISQNRYEGKRFVTINGDCFERGVYEMPESLNMDEILKKTNNYPDFDFFVQVGGDASGVVLNGDQINKPVLGSGSITVYSTYKYEPIELFRKWIDFFQKESCGQCTPCRDGLYRLKEMLVDDEPDWDVVGEILDNLAESSFCGLGCAAPIAIRSYIENVLVNIPEKKIDLPDYEKKMICDCFS